MLGMRRGLQSGLELRRMQSGVLLRVSRLLVSDYWSIEGGSCR